MPTHCLPSAATARDRTATCTFTSDRTRIRPFERTWLVASKANDLFILINENLHIFNTPIKRLFSTSRAQFAIRQVTFDPLEFDTSPMNSHITGIPQQGHARLHNGRNTKSLLSPTNRNYSIWIW